MTPFRIDFLDAFRAVAVRRTACVVPCRHPVPVLIIRGAIPIGLTNRAERVMRMGCDRDGPTRVRRVSLQPPALVVCHLAGPRGTQRDFPERITGALALRLTAWLVGHLEGASTNAPRNAPLSSQAFEIASFRAVPGERVPAGRADVVDGGVFTSRNGFAER